MKGTLIIDTDQNGKVIAWEQHNMAVFTHVYNQILDQHPELYFEYRNTADPTGRYLCIHEVFWKLLASSSMIEQSTDNR